MLQVVSIFERKGKLLISNSLSDTSLKNKENWLPTYTSGCENEKKKKKIVRLGGDLIPLYRFRRELSKSRRSQRVRLLGQKSCFLTGSFPQGGALSHEKDRLTGGLSKLRLPSERSSPEAGPLPVQVLLPVHRARALSALEVAETLGLVLGLALGGRETPVVARRRVGPRLLPANEAARTLGQKVEKLVAGEVVGSHRTPRGSTGEHAAGPQLLGEQFVLVEVADLRCPATGRRRGGRRREGAQRRRDQRVQAPVVSPVVEVSREQQLQVVELVQVRQVRPAVVDPLDHGDLRLGEVSDLPPDSPLASRAASLRRDKPDGAVGPRCCRRHRRRRLRLLLRPLGRTPSASSAAAASTARSPERAATFEVTLDAHARRRFLRPPVKETVPRAPKPSPSLSNAER